MTEGAARLELRALCCERGSRLLFQNLHCSVDSGTALRIKGANGSGKTSLLRIIAGLGSEYEGEVRWRGQVLARGRNAFGADLLYLGHAPGVKAALTPVENLQWWLALQAAHSTSCEGGEQQAITGALAGFSLDGIADTPCYRLSAGQQRRVALARLCLSSHPVWILDEPATALDQLGIATLQALCTAHLGRGGLLLLTTHQPLQVPAGVELDLDVAAGVAA